MGTQASSIIIGNEETDHDRHDLNYPKEENKTEYENPLQHFRVEKCH